MVFDFHPRQPVLSNRLVRERLKPLRKILEWECGLQKQQPSNSQPRIDVQAANLLVGNAVIHKVLHEPQESRPYPVGGVPKQRAKQIVVIAKRIQIGLSQVVLLAMAPVVVRQHIAK